jgi:DNA-binding transcriptional LysR family regulator
MNLSQDQIKAFYEVSRQQSFTKAAEQLGLTQSALSHRIRKLEESLETTLLVRDPAGIRLTETGTRLLEYCRLQGQIEEELLAELMGASNKQIKGSLRIGGASTLLWSTVMPALNDFLSQHQNVQFEMIEAGLSALPELLQTGRVDMIVTCGKVDRMNFEGYYLGDEINTMIESKKKPSRPDVYLDHDPSDQTTINYLKQQGQDPGKTKLQRCFVGNLNGIIAAVDAGLGRAVMPRHLIKNQKNIRPLEGQKEMITPVYLYVLKQPFYSKLHERVIQELNEKLKGFLD